MSESTSDHNQSQRLHRSHTATDVSVAVLGVGATGMIGLQRAMPTTYEHLYTNPSASYWALNQVKGQSAERLMDRVVTQKFLQETGGWVSAPPRAGRQGLDGLFIRAGHKGRIKPPLVVESKYGSSSLSTTTQDGVQMSDSWIRPRMAAPAQHYRTLLWDNSADVVRHATVPTDADPTKVPVSETEFAHVWQDRSGTRHVHVPEGYSTTDVQRGLKQTANILQAAGSGKISYRARLFRYSVADGEHRITLQPVSAEGTPVTDERGRIVEQVIQEAPEDLPETVREALRDSLQKTFEEKGNLPSFIARKLAERCVEQPEYIDRLGLSPRDGYVGAIGGIVGTVGTAAAGGVFAGLISGIGQVAQKGDVDWQRVRAEGVIGGASAGVAYASGGAIHTVLVSTEVGQQIAGSLPVQSIAGQSIERVVGTAGGAAIGSAVYLVGVHLTRSLSTKESRRLTGSTAVKIAAGTGAKALAMSGAAAYGTASTGTAISSLSGAAAQNATLAYLGGGSLASGGLGMTGGAIALTGIGAVAGIVVFGGLGLLFKKIDEGRRKTAIKERLNLTQDRVEAGDQPEWK
jgi:hypothetical protein